jgi:hypothetical protein
LQRRSLAGPACGNSSGDNNLLSTIEICQKRFCRSEKPFNADPVILVSYLNYDLAVVGLSYKVVGILIIRRVLIYANGQVFLAFNHKIRVAAVDV